MSNKRQAMWIEEEERIKRQREEGEGEEEEETELTIISQRLSPLIDVGTMQNPPNSFGFGVNLHAKIMDIDHYIAQIDAQKDEEKKKKMQKRLDRWICKLGAMVFNEVSVKSLSDGNTVSIGGKKRRKSRRRKRTRKRRKKRRRKKRTRKRR